MIGVGGDHFFNRRRDGARVAHLRQTFGLHDFFRALAAGEHLGQHRLAGVDIDRAVPDQRDQVYQFLRRHVALVDLLTGLVEQTE